MPTDLDLNQLNTLIQSANAGWTAAQTSVSELPPDEQKRRLGYDPRGGEESLEQRMSASQAKLAAVKATIGATATAYDWRNVGGKNFVTPIREQGGCGSLRFVWIDRHGRGHVSKSSATTRPWMSTWRKPHCSFAWVRRPARAAAAGGT